MIFTDRLGHSVDIDLPDVETELLALLHAADAACGASTTEPEVERLRHAREQFMKAVDRVKRAEPVS